MFLFPSNGKDFQNTDAFGPSPVSPKVSIPFKRGRTSRTHIDIEEVIYVESFYSLQTGRTSRTICFVSLLSACSKSFYSLQTGRTSRTLYKERADTQTNFVSIPFKREGLPEPVKNYARQAKDTCFYSLQTGRTSRTCQRHPRRVYR